MSEIVKGVSGRSLGHIVKTSDDTYYYVDSVNTPDCGLETMVFLYDEENDKVFSWSDEYVEHYWTVDQMISGHEYICEHLEELIGRRN